MDNVLPVCNNGSGGNDNNGCSDLDSGCSVGDDDDGRNGFGVSGNDGKDDSGDSGGEFASITKSRL
jgi:hypothetical protein